MIYLYNLLYVTNSTKERVSLVVYTYYYQHICISATLLAASSLHIDVVDDKGLANDRTVYIRLHKVVSHKTWAAKNTEAESEQKPEYWHSVSGGGVGICLV